MTNALNIRYYLQLNNEDRFVSFLPMNHIAAQFVDTMIPVMYPVTVYIARPDALRGSLLNTLQLAQPTLFVAVPRVARSWSLFARRVQPFSWRSRGSTRSSWRASVRRTRRRR